MPPEPFNQPPQAVAFPEELERLCPGAEAVLRAWVKQACAAAWGEWLRCQERVLLPQLEAVMAREFAGLLERLREELRDPGDWWRSEPNEDDEG